jgi:hypothetical protein
MVAPGRRSDVPGCGMRDGAVRHMDRRPMQVIAAGDAKARVVGAGDDADQPAAAHPRPLESPKQALAPIEPLRGETILALRYSPPSGLRTFRQASC